jgi:hypothetical protein
MAVICCVLLIPLVLRIYPFPFNHEYYAQLIRQPWLPAERITLESDQNVTGYVLADSSTWLVVLKDSDRRIYYYRADKVTTLQVCLIGQPRPTRPLVTLIATNGGSSATEPCPTHSPTRRPDPESGTK